MTSPAHARYAAELRCPSCKRYEVAEDFRYHDALDMAICQRCQFELCADCGVRMVERGGIPEIERCSKCAEKEPCTGASDSPADSGGSTAQRCATGGGAITVGSGIPRG